MECPECKAQVKVSARQCDGCGADFGPPVDRQPARQQSDASKYAIIIGVALAAIILVFVLANMAGSVTCKECKGKKVKKCLNCKGERPKCLECKGSGADPQTFSQCQRCKGSGTSSVCQQCKGVPTKSCPGCKGTGSKSR